MSGIAGFCDFTPADARQDGREMLTAMRNALKRRGGKVNEDWLCENAGLTATAQVDNGYDLIAQAHRAEAQGCACVFDGSLYNRNTLSADLRAAIPACDRENDAAIVLAGVQQYGADFVKHLDGIFAFAVYNGNELLLFRDHAGVKPLFYTQAHGRFLFASEIKALLAYPGVEARLARSGLASLLLLGPAREETSGIFKDIYAIPPGSYLTAAPNAQTGKPCAISATAYWDLSPGEHTDSELETVATVRALLSEAVLRQTDLNERTCALLSGGVDSSVVTAIAVQQFSREKKRLRTYSFDFKDSDTHFTASDYQPDRDRPWIDLMRRDTMTEHTYIECGPEALSGLLGDAVIARDLPGMADIDASLLYFLSQLPAGSVALTGECADEVFGGYPWFHRSDLYNAVGFPWSSNLDARKTIFSKEFLTEICVDEHAVYLYQHALAKAKQAAGDSGDPEEDRLRQVSYLTIKYFMTTLTDRMDRMGAYSGVDGRVPFADRQLMEYLWNVPWALKKKNQTVKHLLREAMRGYVPEEILFRKKSPFPKTYDPNYTALVAERVHEDILNNANAPVRAWIDMPQLRQFLETPADTGQPWFGQLMAGPQRLAFIWQLNFWLEKYRVKVLC